MGTYREPVAEYYCAHMCTFMSQQAYLMEAAANHEVPRQMCPRIAALAVGRLAENIVSREPDSEIDQPGRDSALSEAFLDAVSEAEHDWKLQAGACVRSLLRNGTDSATLGSIQTVTNIEIIDRLSVIASLNA